MVVMTAGVVASKVREKREKDNHLVRVWSLVNGHVMQCVAAWSCLVFCPCV